MANVFLRKTLYRLEQGTRPAGQSRSNQHQSWVGTYDFAAADIRRIDPVNVKGGASLYGFGWLYSKVTFKQAALLQEAYSLQTTLQWQTELNS